MQPRNGCLFSLVLTAHWLHLVTASFENSSPPSPKPLLVLQKLISGQPSAVERRKAVTIGFNRWLRPLTIQVPDMISNLIPSSSNIIKVHDDSKNKTTSASAPTNAKPDSNQFDPNQNPMLNYDPMQFINNFDPNPFMKSLQFAPQLDGLTFQNSSLPIGDPNQLPNVQPSLYPRYPQHFPSDPVDPHHSMPLNKKPFPRHPLFEHEDGYQNNEPKKTPYYSHQADYYNSGSVEDANQPKQHQHTSVPINGETSKQTYAEYMAEAYRSKETIPKYHSNIHHSNIQQDEQSYYPREQQYNSPHLVSGSGNYDYDSHEHSSLYHSMSHQDENNDKIAAPGGYSFPTKENYHQSYNSEPDQERSSALRPLYPAHHKDNEMASTERSFFRDYHPAMTNNESEYGNDHITAMPYYPGGSGTHLAKAQSNKMESGSKSSMDNENLYENHKVKMTHSEPANYNGYYNNGFHTAASMLNPVIVKGKNREPYVSQDRSTIEKVQAMLPLTGVNVFPSPQMKTLPRPVASRLKEFFKSVLNQKS